MADPARTAISLQRIAKTYRGRVQALRGVDLEVGRGEIFGLLGPNGAGKSTLVKILMSIVRPTGGSGSLLGRPLGHKATLAAVGYLPESARFPRYLTGRQTVEFFGAMSGMRRQQRKQRADAMLELVGMQADAGRRIGTYSKGMVQRIGLAAALVNDPQLVVLDEPTDGLDPLGQRDVHSVLLRLKEERRTTFINSHQLAQLERICDRVAILVAGQVVRQGELRGMMAASARYEIEVEGTDHAATMAACASAIAGLLCDEGLSPAADSVMRGQLRTGPAVTVEACTLRVDTRDALAVQPLLDALRQRGLAIRRLQPPRASLEEQFMEAVVQAEASRP